MSAEAGTVTNIGSYTVSIQSDAGGSLLRYLHMASASLAVQVGDHVTRGQRIGLISNNFGTSSTTIHLHFEVWQNVAGVGLTPVSPYMSLVSAYEDLIDSEAVPCDVIDAGGAVLDDDGPCLTLYGPAATWRHVTDSGYEGGLHWTNAWTGASPGNWAKWSLDFAEAGTYDVEVYLVPAYALSQATPYKLRHAGAETTVVVNHQGLPEGWHSLGELAFAAGGEQALEIYDNTGEASALERHIMIDAVRLTRVGDIDEEDGGGGDDGSPATDEDVVAPDDDEVPPSDPTPYYDDPDAEPTVKVREPDSCNAGRGPSVAGVMLVLLALRRRRR